MDEFKKEFKALLKKHGVYLSFGCSESSDLHGISDMHMTATKISRHGRGFSKATERISDGWHIGSSDL